MTTKKKKRGRPWEPKTHFNSKGNPITASRVGMVMIGSYFLPQVHSSLRILAIREGKTMNAILTEALTDLFAKYDVDLEEAN